MGSADFYPEEAPIHRVNIDSFWMDDHPVTVAEFRRFVRRGRTSPRRQTARLHEPVRCDR